MFVKDIARVTALAYCYSRGSPATRFAFQAEFGLTAIITGRCLRGGRKPCQFPAVVHGFHSTRAGRPPKCGRPSVRPSILLRPDEFSINNVTGKTLEKNQDSPQGACTARDTERSPNRPNSPFSAANDAILHLSSRLALSTPAAIFSW